MTTHYRQPGEPHGLHDRRHPKHRARRPCRRGQDHAVRGPAACGRRDPDAAGSVERGTTVSDHDPMEKERKHSLNADIAVDRPRRLPHQPDRHPRLPPISAAPTLAALAAVETVAIVVNAHQRHRARHAQRMMQLREARALARMLVVNKIDCDGDCRRAWSSDCAKTFGPRMPADQPARPGRQTCGRLLLQPAKATPISPRVAEAHQRIIDQVVEINETVMGHLPGRGRGGSVRQRAARRLRAMPARGTSGADLLRLRAHRRRREGAARRRRAAAAEPRRRQPAAVRQGDGANAAPIQAQPDPDKHVIADVFKIVNDPFVGKLGVFRV